MALNLRSVVEGYLRKNPEQRFTTREIARWIFDNHREECLEKQSRSTAVVIPLDSEEAVIRQLAAEIAARRPSLQEKSGIKTTEGRPRRYYFTKQTDSAEIKKAEQKPAVRAASKAGIREQDLYAVLSEFLSLELGVFSKRIDEKRSRNSKGPRGNKWLHPDLVGMEDLSSEWNREIKDCVSQYVDQKVRLWSFEVKILINRSNVREAFFQAVSNSSWANFGYLVASEVGGEAALRELRMLSNLHGTGFILLDSADASESQIMLPARERPKIDWDTANRLAEENQDFTSYIKLIKEFHQTGAMKAYEWDYKPSD